MSHYVARKARVSLTGPGRGVRTNGITVSDSAVSSVADGARRGPWRHAPIDAVAARRCGAGTPDDIAAACAFLCSDDAGYITGQLIGVNGGWYV
jgi:NAD(P)-dependent dehydrogenase (short-subunit alcohol dehydrogenase family)